MYGFLKMMEMQIEASTQVKKTAVALTEIELVHNWVLHNITFIVLAANNTVDNPIK